MQGFEELVIGGVLVAPFVLYIFGAAILLALLRPLLRRIGFDEMFGNPPMALLCLYVVLVAILVVLA